MPSVLIVGISGVTCGGKTTLAHKLKSAFPQAEVIHQDDFYKTSDDSDAPFIEGTAPTNYWDSLESLDMTSMLQHVHNAIAKLKEHSSDNGSLLIIEGFLIYNYPPLAELCHLKYFVTLPFSDCQSRRATRLQVYPDPPNYFIDVVWPMYLSHLQQIHQTAFADQIRYLDGTESLQQNVDLIVKDVRHLMDIK